MGNIFGSFFSPSQETQGTTTNTQNTMFSNQSQQEDAAAKGILPWLPQYTQTAFNPAPFNAYQTTAGDNQSSVSGAINPALQTAYNISGTGISPSAIQGFVSPYISNVVNPTVQSFETLNKTTADAINGNLASRGALGNSNNSATRANVLAPILNNQNAQIASLYNTGYNQATDTAAKDAALRLNASGTTGSLIGAASGANTALSNIGNFQQFAPLNWMTQGAQGASAFKGLGSSSSSSGSSTGTSTGVNNSTSQYNPSDFQSIAGILGLGASLIPKPAASGGVIRAYDAGGAVPASTGNIMPFQPGSDLPSKVASAFSVLNSITGAAKGGVIRGYDAGGVTPWSTTASSFDPSSAMGDDIVGQAGANQKSMDFASGMQRFGDAAMKQSGGGDDQSKMLSQANSAAIAGLNNQAAGLSSFMAQNQPRPIQGYDGGGVVDWADGSRPAFSDETPGGVIPSFLGGPPPGPIQAFQPAPGGQPVPPAGPVSSGQKMTPAWGGVIDGLAKSPLVAGGNAWTEGGGPAARALLAASGPHIGAPIAAQAAQMVEEHRKKQDADRAHARLMAQMMGQYEGKPTLEAQRATGSINGTPTVEAERFAEEKRVHNRPTWGTIGHDKFGQPVHGWINPNLAPNQGGPGSSPASGGSSGAPAQRGDVPTSPTGAVVPSSDQRAAVVPGPQTNSSPWDGGVIGQDFLKTLDPSTAAMVKGIAEGHDMPAGFGSRSPYWQRVMDMVYQYDPTFNRQDYLRRNATVKDFTGGKSAQNITSFNTALAHLDSLDKAVTGLNNWNVPLGSVVRSVTNPAYAALSPDYEARMKSFSMAKTAVVDELTRAFRGTGGNVHDLIEWSKSLDSADSEKSLRAAIQQGIHLLKGRIDALGNQYERGMGKTIDPVSLLSPKAQEAYDRLSGEGKTKSHGLDAPLRPETVPDGSAYSASRKMWRGPDGTIYDQNGKRIG